MIDKRLLLTIGLSIVTIFAYSQIVNPKIKKTDVTQCQIMQIGLTDSLTFIFFKYTDEKETGGICINEDYYIKDTRSGQKFKLINTLNIPICPTGHVFMSPNESHYYALTFEPLPNETKEIDLIESLEEGGFNFFGVSLEQSNSTSTPVDYIELLENSPVREAGYFIKDGGVVQYFVHKGLAIAMHLSVDNSYGKYYSASISVENNSGKRIDFYPELITAKVYEGEKETEIEVLTYNEYMKKVKNQQSWNSFFIALGESSAASQAGNSKSTTQTNTTFNANSRGYYSGYYGDKYGTVTSNVRTYGNASLTSTTYSYDATASYYARQNANRNISNYNNQQYQIRESINQGYLKSNTIFKEQRLNGYINIKFKKGDFLYVTVPVNNDYYPFVWEIK